MQRIACFAAAVLLIGSLGSAASSQAQTPCVASPQWVNSPQMSATVPGGGATFCSFHQFAWQNFLALIQNNSFLTFRPSGTVFVANGAPAPWNGQQNPLSLGQIFKEAGTHKPLVAVNGAMVQFDVRMNRSWFDTIVAGHLYNSIGFNQACSNINAPIENTDPNDPFGAIELKSAWLPMACNPASGQYVCSSDGKYGLVGFHLVQKMSNHQEWIWASFEHVANAPDCASLNQTPPAPFTSWNFFNNEYYPCVPGSCSPTDCQPSCNLYQAQGPSNVCRATPILQDDVLSSGQSSAGPLVVQLNASVHSLLQNPKLTALKNYNLVGTLWFKPGLTAPPPVGSTNPPSGQIFIGSGSLANTTMETYLQQTNCYSCHVTAEFQFTYNKPGTKESDLLSSEADFSHIFAIQQGPSGTCNVSAQATRAQKAIALQKGARSE